MALFITTRRPDHTLDNSEIDNAIVHLTARTALSRHHRQLPEGPDMEITFMYPGAAEQPPFNGMRMGTYGSSQSTLHFEAAIPPHIADSPRASEYLKALMEDVIDNAQSYFQQSSICFDSDRWREAVQRLLR